MTNGETSEKHKKATTATVTKSATQEAAISEAVVEETRADAAEPSAETIEAVAEEAPAEAAETPAEGIEAVPEEASAEEIIVEPVTSLEDVKRAMRLGEVLGHTFASLHATLDKRGVAEERANELSNKLTATVIRSLSNVLEGTN